MQRVIGKRRKMEMIERLVRQTYNNCHYIEIRDQIGVFRKIYCDSIIPNKKYLDVMYL